MSEINEGAVRQYGWSAGARPPAVRGRRNVFGVPDRHRLVQPAFLQHRARGACGLLLFLAFGLFRGSVDRPLRSAFSWLLAVTGFVLAFYHWIYEGELIQRAGDPTTTDFSSAASQCCWSSRRRDA